jgi:hypothetical protein
MPNVGGITFARMVNLLLVRLTSLSRNSDVFLAVVLGAWNGHGIVCGAFVLRVILQEPSVGILVTWLINAKKSFLTPGKIQTRHNKEKIE